MFFSNIFLTACYHVFSFIVLCVLLLNVFVVMDIQLFYSLNLLWPNYGQIFICLFLMNYAHGGFTACVFCKCAL